MTLPDRIREALAQTEGHSTGPWQLDGGSMVIQDATGHAVCHFGFEGEAGQRVYPLFVDKDAAIIADAPTLRGLLAETLAELERRDRLAAQWHAESQRLYHNLPSDTTPEQEALAQCQISEAHALERCWRAVAHLHPEHGGQP